MDGTGSVAEVNAALRELFSAFVVSDSPGTGAFDGILIQPWQKPGVVPAPDRGEWPKLVRPDDGAAAPAAGRAGPGGS